MQNQTLTHRVRRFARLALLLLLPALPAGAAERRPTLFLIGDSTVKNGRDDGAGALWGWGRPVAGLFDTSRIGVANRALGGRSSRSYRTEGLWDRVLADLRPGDFVLMQFGHNDGGPFATGRARASLKGNGDGVTNVVLEATGKPEEVHSYGWYLRRYVAEARAKGASPVVLSPVPRNRWKDGRVVRASGDYGKWAAEAAADAGAPFVDLNERVARHYEEMGEARVSAEFFTAADHTHTTRAGAELNAHAVAEGLRGLAGFPLAAYLREAAPPPDVGGFPVQIRVDAGATLGELKPIWRFFGADEPNYATMRHGRKLVGELGELRLRDVFFRAHNLLTTGDGTPALKWGSTDVYREDAAGNPVYSWTILDGIFDTYLGRGVRPYVEIGFMPEALSVKPEPYRHHWTPAAKYDEIYTGWAYPPKDYAKWAELVFQWVKHSVAKYGAAEVERWYWQVWNEPNIGYWRGTPEEFHRLHDHAVDAVRRALPSARVGGPDVAGSGGGFSRSFFEHCLRGTNYATGRVGTPLDFVSFHAKGAPVFTDGHVRMGIANQLRTIEEGFRIIASFPELKGTPVVIGESDPEGCAACQGPQLAYRNGTMFSSYTAAVFARKHDLAARAGVNLEGALTWAFEFEDQPWFAGFRSLASNGVDKPVLNVFRMFSRMNGQRIEAVSDAAVALDDLMKDGVRGRPDVAALASLDQRRLAVMVWHYHDDDLPGASAEIEMALRRLPFPDGPVRLTHYRIDADHSNAFAVWQRMGSPQNPDAAQIARLERAGGLATLGGAGEVSVRGGAAILRFPLPRQGVSLLVLEPGE